MQKLEIALQANIRAHHWRLRTADKYS